MLSQYLTETQSDGTILLRDQRIQTARLASPSASFPESNPRVRSDEPRAGESVAYGQGVCEKISKLVKDYANVGFSPINY